MKILLHSENKVKNIDPCIVKTLLESDLTEFDDELYDIMAVKMSDKELEEFKESNIDILETYCREKGIPFVYGDSLLNANYDEYSDFRIFNSDKLSLEPLTYKFELNPYMLIKNNGLFAESYSAITIL